MLRIELPATTAPARRSPAARQTLLLGLGLCLLLVCVALSLALGSRAIPPSTVIDALLGHHAGSGPDAQVVTGLRLPRTVLGLVVGAALGVAGAVAQGVTRNPLASPTTLGVNAGASFAVVTAIYALQLTRPVEYVWFAVAARAWPGWRRRPWPGGRRVGSHPARARRHRADRGARLLDLRADASPPPHLDEARFWLAGSLGGRGLEVLTPVWPLLLVGLVLAVAVTPALNALALGEETAQALGVPVARIRTAAALAVVLLAAGAVAIAGPIAFVGLAAPHLVRLLLGADQRWLVPGCAIAGPVLLLTADVLGRLVARPSELEVGIVTAFLGAPLLAVLARRAAW